MRVAVGDGPQAGRNDAEFHRLRDTDVLKALETSPSGLSMAWVMRAGHTEQVPRRELVRGDIKKGGAAWLRHTTAGRVVLS